MNRQARSWMPAIVFLAVAFLGFWFISRQMTRNYSYTEQEFVQDLQGDRVGEVYIRPNREVPTGQIFVTLIDGTDKDFYALDVKEIQDDIESKYPKVLIRVGEVPRQYIYLFISASDPYDDPCGRYD